MLHYHSFGLPKDVKALLTSLNFTYRKGKGRYQSPHFANFHLYIWREKRFPDHVRHFIHLRACDDACFDVFSETWWAHEFVKCFVERLDRHGLQVVKILRLNRLHALLA